jgi:hypothetical protein
MLDLPSASGTADALMAPYPCKQPDRRRDYSLAVKITAAIPVTLACRALELMHAP